MGSRTVMCLVAAGWMAAAFPVASAHHEKGCMDCHGKEGASTESDVPIIGGYSDFYLEEAMLAYRDGARPCPESDYRAGDTARPPTDMCRIAKAMSEDEIKQVAAYFAAKPFVPARQTTDPQKAAAGARLHEQHCSRCHEDGGSVADDDAGILAGQLMPYLEFTFKAYKDGKREMPERMQEAMDKLSPADIEALIHYYGSQGG